ncbi:hypothetical protein LKM00_26310 [Bacillus wiedmannii]|uniref:hypothetical protein n=1 Tax=Bacillus wiedmannii TaxID=1890302 RepID=UPI001E2F8E84|nr:hypothetical protein [Bacillus wiedmannii]MCC2380914.1 hypothetical protein [Bacillus wiedmannii]MCC2425376.1 hypothetical protein [Bacillus wiedmannii]
MESQMIDDALEHGIEFGKGLKKKNINITSTGQRLNHFQQNENHEKFVEMYFKLAMEIGVPVNKKIVTGDKKMIQSFLIGLSQEF